MHLSFVTRDTSMVVGRHLLAGLCALGVMPTALRAEQASRYRDHTMGDRVADVLGRTKARPTDVKTVHQRPSMVQSLEWHAPYASPESAPDPARSITFGFVDGQLYELSVDYDRTRVGELTAADLVAGVADVYGPRQSASVRAPVPPGSAAGTVVLGYWADAQATVTLVRGPYEDLRLVVRSTALGAQATRAIAAAVAQDVIDAPSRRAEARATEAAVLRDTRTKNRSAFRP